ncbi:hypothetical protein VIN7_6891 [Saccharomyces cerevisiae x Saccharomyces kudriavzevii VIN7]|uniref:Uncharacterized protein n=1 Tax=Saccharomyces cerevisiae x Saccharomyces kudriavzevii (strain VIN7) TaxID=1095631 RepID=H0GUB4_SACCK|nr:hypothetical protein VIN7_6891 [Saccharomyces cerevisiae x Saccharomyces kudriavzevii VIN7]
MNSGRNSSIEDETRTASQENNPKENINLETSTEDTKRESVRIAETTETTKDDVEIAKETQKGEEVEPADAAEDFKNDGIAGSAGIIEKDIKPNITELLRLLTKIRNLRTVQRQKKS